MSLVRLRQRQVMDHATRNTQHESRTALIDAHTLLVEIYNWFTEGFDTADLKDARSLLEELASNGVVTSLSGSTPVADKSKKSRAR